MMIMFLARYINKEDGFTLVEMMVAFALLGLVITTLYSFYFSSLQAWNRSLDRMEYQQTARIAMDKMIRELQYAHLVKCSIGEDPDTRGVTGDILYFRIDINGTSTRHSFRLNATQLHYDRRRDSNNSIRSTNVIALGVTGLEFYIDELDTVFITVTAGEGPGKTVLRGAVRPRNLPLAKPGLEGLEAGVGAE